MTTIAADDGLAACDSLWCDQNGNHVDPPDIRKYLYIPENLDIAGVNGAPSVSLFCGDIEPIVLHQLYLLGLISESTLEYELDFLANKISRQFQFGFFVLSLPQWHVDIQDGVEAEYSLVFGGTGGHLVRDAYRAHFDLVEAVNEAILNDQSSGFPTIIFDKGLLSGSNAQCITEADCDSLNQYFDDYVQWQGGAMASTYKHAGYRTSMAEEAPKLDIKQHMKKLKQSVRPKMGYTVTKLDSGRFVARDVKTGRFIPANKAPEIRIAISRQIKSDL